MSTKGQKRAQLAQSVSAALFLPTLRILVRFGFLRLKVVLYCELEHVGARPWVPKRTTTFPAFFRAGAIVLAESLRFGF
jgi:hypothetical protein